MLLKRALATPRAMLSLSGAALGAALMLTTPTESAAGPKCHTRWQTGTSANIWCEGRGPQRYGASIVCKKEGQPVKQLNYRPGPWLGDRRGISMYCPGGGYWRSHHFAWFG